MPTARKRPTQWFEDILGAFGISPVPLKEYGFDPTRGWRFDYAWPELKVAVEIHGGGFGGRHAQVAGQGLDFDKINAATMQGWSVLQFNAYHFGSAERREAVGVLLENAIGTNGGTQ